MNQISTRWLFEDVQLEVIIRLESCRKAPRTINALELAVYDLEPWIRDTNTAFGIYGQ